MQRIFARLGQQFWNLNIHHWQICVYLSWKIILIGLIFRISWVLDLPSFQSCSNFLPIQISNLMLVSVYIWFAFFFDSVFFWIKYSWCDFFQIISKGMPQKNKLQLFIQIQINEFFPTVQINVCFFWLFNDFLLRINF